MIFRIGSENSFQNGVSERYSDKCLKRSVQNNVSERWSKKASKIMLKKDSLEKWLNFLVRKVDMKSQDSFETWVTQVTSHVVTFQWSRKDKSCLYTKRHHFCPKTFHISMTLVISLNQQIHLLILNALFSRSFWNPSNTVCNTLINPYYA